MLQFALWSLISRQFFDTCLEFFDAWIKWNHSEWLCQRRRRVWKSQGEGGQTIIEICLMQRAFREKLHIHRLLTTAPPVCQNCCFLTISSQFFAIYTNIFHKTKILTVILRCLVCPNLNLIKSYDMLLLKIFIFSCLKMYHFWCKIPK